MLFLGYIISISIYYRFYEILNIMEYIGNIWSLSLPGFHAMSGSDANSVWINKDKKTLWDAWTLNPAVTQLFHLLPTPVPNPLELAPHKQVLHIFVNSVYNADSASDDEAQLDGIIFGGKDFSSIPHKYNVVFDFQTSQASMGCLDLEYCSYPAVQAHVYLCI